MLPCPNSINLQNSKAYQTVVKLSNNKFYWAEYGMHLEKPNLAPMKPFCHFSFLLNYKISFSEDNLLIITKSIFCLSKRNLNIFNHSSKYQKIENYTCRKNAKFMMTLMR